MPWIKVDDHFDEHPKLAQVGPLGWALWFAGLAYCNRNLTDGFIPWTIAQNLVSWEFIGNDVTNGDETIVFHVGVVPSGHELPIDLIDADFVIGLLLTAKVWTKVRSGYRVHDYENYQPSKANVLAERERGRERVAKHRERLINGVDKYVDNSAGVTALQDRSNGGVTEKSRRSSVGPVPVPVPLENLTPTPSATAQGDHEKDQRNPRAKGTNPRAVAAQVREERKRQKRAIEASYYRHEITETEMIERIRALDERPPGPQH